MAIRLMEADIIDGLRPYMKVRALCISSEFPERNKLTSV
jgi:hypothetical protein